MFYLESDQLYASSLISSYTTSSDKTREMTERLNNLSSACVEKEVHTENEI